MKANHRVMQWLALLALVTLNLQFPTAFAQGVSFTTNIYNVGGSPVCVVAADVKGEGNLDLITVNGGSTLVVLTNNGSGIFSSNATYSVGFDAISVIAVDVNGDGKPDLITANYGTHSGLSQGHTLTVLTNNGTGSFGFNATLNVGLNPTFVIAADVNADGKLDLISANSGDNTVTVLTNNGNGVFGSNATYSVGTFPTCVAAADVNGDGKLDLISANSADGTLMVLTNNGSGGFGSNATYNLNILSFPSNPWWVIALDVNGDSKPDLITANSLSSIESTLSVLTNNGSGSFGLNATLNVGIEPQCVVAADVNGDGKPDLVSANRYSGTLTVLTNNGSGGFGYSATLSVGGYPSCVIAADVNGDGKPDLITANPGVGTLTVLVNTTPFLGPALNITSVGNQIALYWPASATNYVLESTTNLSASDWVAVTNGTPFTDGVTLTNTSPAAFFRLHQF